MLMLYPGRWWPAESLLHRPPLRAAPRRLQMAAAQWHSVLVAELRPELLTSIWTASTKIRHIGLALPDFVQWNSSRLKRGDEQMEKVTCFLLLSLSHTQLVQIKNARLFTITALKVCVCVSLGRSLFSRMIKSLCQKRDSVFLWNCRGVSVRQKQFCGRVRKHTSQNKRQWLQLLEEPALSFCHLSPNCIELIDYLV